MRSGSTRSNAWPAATPDHHRSHPDDAKKYTVEPIVGGSGDVQVAEKFRLMLSVGGADMPDMIRLNRIEVPEFAEPAS